jgi:hypothetical protein
MASDEKSENNAASTTTQDQTMERPITPPENSSDGERERSTREKLKKTSIAGLSQQVNAAGDNAVGGETLAGSIAIDAPAESGSLRGRPSKKRSFEELAKQEQPNPAENGTIDPQRAGHKRMRSREVPHDADLSAQYDETGEAHIESDEDAQRTPGGPGVIVDAEIETDQNAQVTLTVEDQVLQSEDTTNEPTVSVGAETGLPSTVAQEPKSSSEGAAKSTLSPGSGFANVSSTSPFGAKSPSSGADVKPPSETSASAFASSGLSAFASQNKSPFGAAATTKSSGGFGGVGSGFGGTTSKLGGGFGSTSSTSSFGAAPSPFGASKPFGSSFGGAKPSAFGSASKGFAGGEAPKPFGGAPARFGSKNSKDDEDEEDDGASETGEDQQQENDEDKQDSRFHQQECMFGFNWRILLLILLQSKPVKNMRKASSKAEPSYTISKRNGRREALVC